jgi:ABC-type Fe3+/spermidine/putrescine transport system ATPase subunit
MEAELSFPDAKDGSGSLDAVGIVKRYAIVSVFEGVDCSLRPGRIHTVIGENGAGKSTLFKIMSGLVQPTNGALKLDGEPITLGSPRIAHHRGIYLVPQEPALMAARAVAETKFGEPLPTRGRAKAPRWGFRPRASRLEPEDEIGRRFPYWRGTRLNFLPTAPTPGPKWRRSFGDRQGETLGRPFRVRGEVAFSEIGSARDPGRPRRVGK